MVTIDDGGHALSSHSVILDLLLNRTLSVLGDRGVDKQESRRRGDFNGKQSKVLGKQQKALTWMS
jgi:hypothetical protein